MKKAIFGGFAAIVAVILMVAGCDISPEQIKQKTLDHIRVTTPPVKTLYVIGEQFEQTGLVVTAFYSDGSSEPVTDYELSGFSSVAVGQKTVTVTYQSQTTTFTVTIAASPLASISVTGPEKTEYFLGDEFDRDGLVVTATYQNGTTDEVTDYTVSSFNSSTAGEKTITVTYRGKTATFTVTVSVPPLASIAVTKQSDKTVYDVNETLVITGMVVTATYENSYKAPVSVTLDDITGFDSSTKGTQTLTVTYQDETTTFTVVVSPITQITITTMPTKTEYNRGEQLNISGMVVTATYENGYRVPISVTNNNITGFNSSIQGTQTLTVTYRAHTATFTVIIYNLGTPSTTRENAVLVTVGHSASYTISLNGEHWFKFAANGDPVIFETTGNVVDTYMEVYRDDNTSIYNTGSAYDNDSGEGSNALCSYTSTTSGSTYFIKITTRNQTSGTYSLVVKQPTANIRTNPISVSLGNSSSHIINSSSTHWFKFEGTGNRVFFETEGNVVRTSISIFAGTNTSSSYSGANPISFFTVSGTTYYISITGNAGTYTFKVRSGDGDGSSRYKAKTVAVGNSTSHTINLNGEHWFMFFGTGNPVTFETTGNAVDTYMEVYRDNNTSIYSTGSAYDNDSGEGLNARVRYNPATSGSTYFIKITQRQSTQGAYTFVVE